MWNKLSRLSFLQLRLLQWFLAHPDQYGTVESLSRQTKVRGKSLGGVISSLSRSKFRGLALIEPWGRPQRGTGLRWKLNSKLGGIAEAKKEVARLLAAY